MAVVAGATSALIRRSEFRLPPLIQYSTTGGAAGAATVPSRRLSPVRLPRLRMDGSSGETSTSGGGSSSSHSTTSESEMNVVEALQNRTLFICGFVAKRWHNSSLQALIHDLIPHYYVACNDDSTSDHARTRELLSHADALVFFVNEFTLGDLNCLLTLQYAWHLMVPVIMLRPPRTKLVICKRSNKKREEMRVVGNGSIIRSPSARWALVGNETINTVDYGLLQDILYEGYKLSVVYDRLEHHKSMIKIKERITSVLKPVAFDTNRDKVGFYLSPSNDSSNSVTITTQSSMRSKIKSKKNKKEKEKKREIRLSQSLNNLESEKVRKRVPGTPRKPKENQLIPQNTSEDDERREEQKEDGKEEVEDQEEEVDDSPPTPKSEDVTNGNIIVPEVVKVHTEPPKPPPLKKQLSIKQHSVERRMSLSSLDDRSNFTNTQYLIFPMRDPAKKPQLIKFPEDLMEEQWHDDSVWGSDTSLEEEVQLAPRITAGISLDEDGGDSLSPSYSPAPAPYIDPL